MTPTLQRSNTDFAIDDPEIARAATIVAGPESQNRLMVGTGGQDLSKYIMLGKITPHGFPDWPGINTPKGNSTAAGAFQITKTNWEKYAGDDVKDFSWPNQVKVFTKMYRAEGFIPWDQAHGGPLPVGFKLNVINAPQQNGQVTPEAIQAAIANIKNQLGETGAEVQHTPVAQGYSPETNDITHAMSVIQNSLNNDNAGLKKRYQQSAGIVQNDGGGALDAIGHFFRSAGQSLKRGLVDQLGMPADAVNALDTYYARHPSQAGALAGDLGGYVPNVTEGLPDQPNAKSLMMPGGAGDIRKLAGKIGINTDLPSEYGDTSGPGRLGEAVGYAVGSALPFAGGPISEVNALSKIPGAAVKIVGAPAAIGGIGRELGEDLEGWGAPKGVAQIGGTLGAGSATAAATVAARTLIAGGLEAALKSGNDTLQNSVRGSLSAGAVMRRMSTNPNAVENIETGAALEGLPEGFQTPAATASMDLAHQTAMQNIVKNDFATRAQYDKMLLANEGIMRNLAPTTDVTPEEVTGFLANLQNERMNAKQLSVKQAVDKADSDFSSATSGASFDPDEARMLKRAAEVNLKGHLIGAYNDASATTRSELDAARAAGLDQATVPTSRLYDKLAGMISSHIQSGYGDDHFPSDALRTIYKGDPLKMFDSGGSPIGSLESNYMFDRQEPWQRFQGLYNDISGRIAQQLRAGNDPIKLQYLSQMQDEVMNSMKDLRFGGKFTPGAVPAHLQNAINSAEENKRLFVDSPVGSLLGMNQNTMPGNDAGQSIRAWLGVQPGNISRMQSLFDAVAPSSLPIGQHPATAVKSALDSYLRQDFYDTYRNGDFRTANQWMNKNATVLDHPQFEPLRDEFRQAINSRQVADSIGQTAPKDIDALRQSRTSLFLNDNPEAAFNTALKGPNKFDSTMSIINDLKQDPTGRALEGFGSMAFQRMLASASEPNLSNIPGKAFNGIKAAQYYNDNQGMFKAIDSVIPGFDSRAQQFTKAAEMMERIQTNPGLPIPQQMVDMSLTGIGRIAARMVGAEFGRKLGTGTIQVPGYMAKAAEDIYNSFAKIPTDKASNLLARAMIEPDTYQQMMQPITEQNAGKMSTLLEPYVLSSPQNVIGTYEQKNNPQPPMGGAANQMNPSGPSDIGQPLPPQEDMEFKSKEPIPALSGAIPVGSQ